MRHIFILVCLSVSIGAVAQPGLLPAHAGGHDQLLGSLLQVQQPAVPLSKTASGATAFRVRAQSTRNNSLASLSDSVDLQYTGVHYSTYDYNRMLFPYNYPYATSPMFSYRGVFTQPQVLFDNYVHWTVNPFTNIYGLYEGATATYDASSNLTAFMHLFVDSVTNKNVKYSNTFTTGNEIASGYSYNEHSGIYDSAFSQFFAYDATGKLTTDSTYEFHLGVWRIASRTIYTYDGAGNLTQIDNYGNTTDTSFLLPLIEQEQYINTYDAGGRLLTVLTSLYDGTALDQSIKDTFAYTAALAFHTSWKQYQYDPINHYWAPISNMVKHLNALALPDTVLTMGFDSLANSWVPGFMDVVTYNAGNKPQTIDDYGYNFTAFPATPDYTTTYYYDTYIDYTAVPLTGAAAHRAIVYPNPTSGSITIANLDAAPGAILNIMLTNAKGQLISRARQSWQGSCRLTLQDLAPGIYWLQVSDAVGKTIHCQAVELR